MTKHKNARRAFHSRRANVHEHESSITPLALYVCAALVGGLIGLVWVVATVYNAGFQDALRIVGAA